MSRKDVWRERMLRSSYFFGAVVFHLLLFFFLAALVVLKSPPPPPADEFRPFMVKLTPPTVSPPVGSAAVNAPQPKPQLVMTTATPPSLITTIHSTFAVDVANVMARMNSEIDLPLPRGSGAASSSGHDSGDLGNGYGTGNGDGFVGTLYDLKQTPDHKPTDIAENDQELGDAFVDPNWPGSMATQQGLKLLRSFVSNWDMSLLDDYFKAPNTLSAVQICVPLTPSVNAPQAFQVEGTVRARRWIVIYNAKVIAPVTGRFRFVGFADDFMVVRVDGQNVLDASLRGEELDPNANTDEDVGMGPEHQPLHCGKWIQLDAGVSLNMQVLIGEGPGGLSCFLLMIQQEGVATVKGDYPVFQLQDAPVPEISPDFTFSKTKTIFHMFP